MGISMTVLEPTPSAIFPPTRPQFLSLHIEYPHLGTNIQMPESVRPPRSEHSGLLCADPFIGSFDLMVSLCWSTEKHITLL